MSDPNPNRRSNLLALASRVIPTSLHHRQPSGSRQPLGSNPSSPTPYHDIAHPRPSGATSPSYSDPFTSSHGHGVTQLADEYGQIDELAPPVARFNGNSRLSSRLSSFSSDKGSPGLGRTAAARPQSLSVNYVPAKFTKPHAKGEWAHRRAKEGGGRDAFASDASRMGMMGTVDDDEGVAFQLGKGGLRRRTAPKLRWNRFKFVLFGANTVVSTGRELATNDPEEADDADCASSSRTE